MIADEDVSAFGAIVEELIAFKMRARQRPHVGLGAAGTWCGSLRTAGRLGRCRPGMAVVNPDGTLSPCGLHVRAYATHAALKREFTARNDCSACYTSTRGNSERPLRNLVLDHVNHLRRRAEA